MSGRQDAEYVEYVESRLTWLRRVAYLLCQDWHSADDLVQVTVTRLFTHWPRARRMDNVDGYVRTILFRTFLGERRSLLSRGRRDRRWRQAISGGSTLAIAAVAGAVVTLVVVPGSRTAVTPSAGGSGTPVPSASATPAPSTTPGATAATTSPVVAPKQFDPMVPYASFGWLPAGYTVGGPDTQLTASTQTVSLGASAGNSSILLTVNVAGACTPTGAPSLPVLTCHLSDGSISGPLRATGVAPQVNGRPAFWSRSDVSPAGKDKDNWLIWEYAPNAWSILLATTGPEVPPASVHATLSRVAANVRYTDTTPIRFPFWFTGVPAGWTATSASFGVTSSGELVGQGLNLGPAVDPGALSIDVIPAPPGNSCKFIVGQSQHVTLDGVSAVLRTLNEPGKGYQSLCSANMRGMQVFVGLDTTETASNTPLPGVAGLDGALGVARALHLLGADPANWTTSPLRGIGT
ncbi:MAG TPA: sigma factor [Streptosporangiaceae bacterium]